jgi:hypothetical protein
MGYLTYRIFRGVPLARLRRKVRGNLALYDPGTVGRRLATQLVQGDGCSAIVFGTPRHDAVFAPIGLQLGGVWMDVRYQDGDSWDLSAYEGAEHRVSHDVNPWAHERRVEYDQAAVDFRIRRVGELWPDQAGRIERYLLPWRFPQVSGGRTRLVRRTGKAYDTDDCGYGDADQVYDFVQAFGIGPTSRTIKLDPHE